MNKLLEYKGYKGSIEADLEDKCLYGQALFLADAIIYQGRDIEELEACFQQAIDEYLETCAELEKDPERPFSGSFNLRMPQDLHRQLAYKAVEEGIKLNALVNKACLALLENSYEQTIVHTHKLQHEHHVFKTFEYPKEKASDFTAYSPKLKLVGGSEYGQAELQG